MRHHDKSLTLKIEPGQEAVLEVRLDELVEPLKRGRVRFGVGVGANLVFLSYVETLSGFSSQQDVPTIDGEGDFRYSLGGFVDLRLKSPLFFEAGLRFVRLGDTAVLEYDDGRTQERETYQDYLGIPLLLKLYVSRSHGFFFAVGPEVGIRLRSRAVWESGEEEKLELENTNVSLNGGLGYEFEAFGVCPFFYLQFALGLTNAYEENPINWRTREFKLSTGVVF